MDLSLYFSEWLYFQQYFKRALQHSEPITTCQVREKKMPKTQHGGFLMVIQILCSISLPKSSCGCLEYNPPTNTNTYILGIQALVTMRTK